MYDPRAEKDKQVVITGEITASLERVSVTI